MPNTPENESTGEASSISRQVIGKPTTADILGSYWKNPPKKDQIEETTIQQREEAMAVFAAHAS